ncbi:MAG TPA: lactonase family protein [Bryobacteraceae bacterium]|nr:lactonase family protein [Bryobacteraceae bacterium]
MWQPQEPILAYVGTYTGATGAGGNGDGIYLYRMDPSSGMLAQVSVAARIPSPSWMAIHPNGHWLYAASDLSGSSSGSGSVSAFSIDRASGALTPLNVVSSQGAGPAYVSVHPSGKYLLVANYFGGSIAVLPILAGGSVGDATDVHIGTGSPGPTQAASAPPGSFAISGHDGPHPHMIQSDPSGRYVLHTDLGTDRIFVWTIGLSAGKLAPHTPPYVSLPPGDGPRHFVFHPNGKWFYSVQEEASTIARFDWDPGSGTLSLRQTLSTLPQGFAGTSFISDVRISRDGGFIYAANRLHDSIAIFAVDPQSGDLALVDEALTRGDYPRSFSLDPAGGFLFSCNQRSDAVTAFRVEEGGRRLAFTGQYTPVGSPAMILFLT